MISNQEKSNLLTAAGVVLTGFSLMDIINFAVGLIVLFGAGVSNYYSYKKNRADYERIKKQNQKDDEK